MVAGASFLAASPLLGEGTGNAGDGAISSEECRSGSLIYHRQSSLSRGFVHPPQLAGPWVYWVWLGVDTTPAPMTYDMEQMKAKGIAGFILYGNQAGSMPREIPTQILVEKDHHFDYEYVKNDDFDDFTQRRFRFRNYRPGRRGGRNTSAMWREKQHVWISKFA